MKLLFCVLFIATILHVTVKSRESEDYPGIDALIQRLKQDEWNDDEIPCLEKTLQWLVNVKNFTLWATWVWDANKFPSSNLYGSWNQLSNFAQCMNPPWLKTHPQYKTQYCLAEVEMTQIELTKRQFDPLELTEKFLRTKTLLGLPVNRFTWGVCVPASCQPLSIVKLVKNMYLGTHFRAISKPNITIDNCQVAGMEDEYSTGFYLFMFLLATLLLMSVTSTFYLMYIRSHTKVSNTIGAVLLKSFCMKNNSAELTKLNKDNIGVFNGIRFITATCVVLIHIISLTMASGCFNTGDFNKENHYLYKMLASHVTVDTFFAMSGLLLIKGLFSKKENIFFTFCKRYVRLVGPVAISAFYSISVIKYLGSGPFWKKYFESESLICHENLLYSLLLLDSNISTTCYPVLWYVACDYQLSIFATILFYIYQRKKSFAIKVFGFSAVMSLVIPGFLTYWHNIPSIFGTDIELMTNYRGHKPYDYVYTKSYTRAGPYLVGIAMGYLMHIYKPTQYRRSISTVFSIIGTVISVMLMLVVLTLGGSVLYQEQGALEAAVIAAFYRTIWAVAVCCIIGMCEYGYVPLVTKILRLPIFTPLSRLSYGLYVVHVGVILHTNKALTIQSPPVFNIFASITDAVGIIMVSLGISYVLWLTVEAPLRNLSDHFIFTRWKVTGGYQAVPETELKKKEE